MSMFQIFNVSGSAVSAQSQRLNVVASNLANADAVAGPDGKAYKAKEGAAVLWPNIADLLASPDAMLLNLDNIRTVFGLPCVVAVNAFHSDQFNIACRAGSTDKRQRPCNHQSFKTLFQARNHLVCTNDTDMMIRNQRYCPPTLPLPGIQNDSA